MSKNRGEVNRPATVLGLPVSQLELPLHLTPPRSADVLRFTSKPKSQSADGLSRILEMAKRLPGK